MKTNYKLVVDNSLKDIESAQVGRGFHNQWNLGHTSGLKQAIEIIKSNIAHFSVEIVNGEHELHFELGKNLSISDLIDQGLLAQVVDLKSSINPNKIPWTKEFLKDHPGLGEYKMENVFETNHLLKPKMEVLEETSKKDWGRYFDSLGIEKRCTTWMNAFHNLDKMYLENLNWNLGTIQTLREENQEIDSRLSECGERNEKLHIERKEMLARLEQQGRKISEQSLVISDRDAFIERLKKRNETEKRFNDRELTKLHEIIGDLRSSQKRTVGNYVEKAKEKISIADEITFIKILLFFLFIYILILKFI